jgi:hypothetical protein
VDVQRRFTEVLAREPALASVPLLGVIKEVAKEGEDEKLGVGVFQKTYFGGRPLYLDEDRQFYKFLGTQRPPSK